MLQKLHRHFDDLASQIFWYLVQSATVVNYFVKFL